MAVRLKVTLSGGAGSVIACSLDMRSLSGYRFTMLTGWGVLSQFIRELPGLLRQHTVPLEKGDKMLLL